MLLYRDLQIRQLGLDGERLVQIVRAKCGRLLAEEDYAGLVGVCSGLINEMRNLEAMEIGTEKAGVLVFNKDGWKRDWAPSLVEREESGDSSPWWSVFLHRDDQRLKKRVEIVGAEDEIGWLEVVVSATDEGVSYAETYAMIGRVGGVTVCLGAVLSFFFARNLTRPMRDLQAYAQRVAGGALTARVKIDTDDEIGDLAASIMRMVQNLDLSQRQLKDSMRNAASLREKEVLLREIHHRVKNNMQILTSLLRLQTRRAGTPELRDMLQDSEARIRSMGLLHEKLYQSESVSLIDLRSYLETLTSQLLSMDTGRVKADIRVTAHQVNLGLDSALPCGLIVTELVSNALKYAFTPDSVNPTVVVNISKMADGGYSLVVWDNGIGIPPEIDLANCESLGLRLVGMLTDQLDGVLMIDGTEGTRAEIRFKESEYANRY
ncbi:MAG: histidine kinase dimerization/phosphoacceptor domain -containing protein [Verrucomicrobiales bacterium]|nr:histidine kinase dimerization/phosphoacceptor domain -containing protein [Verrucomicrobiales bacterium]